ncbi:MAG TPA: SRPBCC domain-containing protein [Flavipsychrobacter sp.]|nr:SRPBCC domain-containing protein [Flavipsychrobacter sp.]
MEDLSIKASIQIQKPAREVFEAIVDPEKMSHYFIERGSARLEEEKTVTWKWPEFEGDNPVRGGKIEQDHYISFYWDGAENVETLVEMKLESKDAGTKITVTEGSLPNDEKGIKWLKGNTEGWANFLACLKAYLEYGINLRKGAFDFMKA